MKILLIRHGATEGNLQQHYLGNTDESLCPQGVAGIKAKIADGAYIAADKVYVSPMKRCQETADLIYPKQAKIVVENLKECDFGDFEGKSYKDLTGNPKYQKWIDSNGKLPFPNGESLESFAKRSVYAFAQIVDESLEAGLESIAIVAHGGTSMAVMAGYTGGEYFDFKPKNGGGYLLELDKTMWQAKLFKTLKEV